MRLRIEGFAKDVAREYAKQAVAAGVEVVGYPDEADIYMFGPFAEKSAIEQAKKQGDARIIEVADFGHVLAGKEPPPVAASRDSIPHAKPKKLFTTIRIAAILLIIVAIAISTLSAFAEKKGRFVYKADFTNKVFHLSDCPNVEQIKDKAYSDDYNKLMRMGLRPCRNCIRQPKESNGCND